MSDEASNTGAEQEKPRKKGTFTKGDARINRRGRPKSFDKLRELAVSLANEAATGAGGVPIEIDGHTATQIEMLLRTMMRENPARFVEIAFGKVPDKLEITTHDIDREIERELARVAVRSKATDAGGAESENDTG